jgi:hypothetical protein
MPISAVALRALALLALPLSSPVPGPSDAAQPVAAVEQCVTAANQSERSATFDGQMTAIAGTQRMAMRIDLQERTRGEPSFHMVAGPGLGVWRASDPGVKIYKFVRQVTNLPAPASFRALVSFRWIGGKGRVIRHTVRRTPPCEQPEVPFQSGAPPPVRHMGGSVSWLTAATARMPGA